MKERVCAPGPWLPGLAILALALPVGVRAQHDAPPPPAAYALEGVSVITADGRMDGVNVVVRNGLIEAVGPDAVIPGDARLLEGDSLLVYPGLVDGHSGIEAEWPEPDYEEDEVFSWDPPRAASGFTPHRRAAHHLVVVGEDLDDQRKAGVVAGAVHADGGLAPGQATVLVYRKGAETSRDLVAHEVAGLDLTFDGAGGFYPSTLFGVIAYHRQSFMDADRHETARTAYSADPSGLTSPPWDPDYEALRRAAAREIPVFFHGSEDEAVRRAIQLADEIGFRMILVGGQEAWEVAGELQQRSVAVLASLDFPDPDEWDPDDTTAAELEPAAAREKERLEDLYANAARLLEAGVTVALTSGGGEADLREGAMKAIEYGLDPADALRALTTTPAELLNIPAVSRPEAGMAATFVVTDGELFDEDTEIRYTFVEGMLEEGAVPGEDAGTGEAPAADVSGTWEGDMEAQGAGSFEVTLVLTMEEDGTLSGSAETAQGPAEIEGTVSGRAVTIRIIAEGLPEPIVVSGTLSEDNTTITGSADTPFGELTMTVEKEPGGASETRGGGR